MAAGTEVEVVTFALRTDEHRDTMLTLVERVASAAGYSPQDFGLNIEGRAESGTALRLRRSLGRLRPPRRNGVTGRPRLGAAPSPCLLSSRRCSASLGNG